MFLIKELQKKKFTQKNIYQLNQIKKKKKKVFSTPHSQRNQNSMLGYPQQTETTNCFFYFLLLRLFFLKSFKSFSFFNSKFSFSFLSM